MDPYHRMDISMTLTPRKNKDRKYDSQWVFGVYNVYNRANLFFIFFANEGSLDVKGTFKSLQSRLASSLLYLRLLGTLSS